jgi:glutathione S-transferase
MLRLYGITQSRAFRPLWLLHELGLPFEHIRTDYRGDAVRDPAYLALNPNGRIPTLVDGDLVLWESMAINLYLARKYGGETGLWPDTIEDEALSWQWSFWVMTEIEHALLTVLMHSRVLPEDKRDPQRVPRNIGVLQTPFKVLDQALAGRDYLLGGRFTVADLNVASVLVWARPARVSLEEYPQLDAWLTRCLDRPARKTAQVA